MPAILVKLREYYDSDTTRYVGAEAKRETGTEVQLTDTHCRWLGRLLKKGTAAKPASGCFKLEFFHSRPKLEKRQKLFKLIPSMVDGGGAIFIGFRAYANRYDQLPSTSGLCEKERKYLELPRPLLRRSVRLAKKTIPSLVLSPGESLTLAEEVAGIWVTASPSKEWT
jgi:hypothetical protein